MSDYGTQDPPIPPQSPPVGNCPVMFTASDGRRVADAVKYVERFYRNPPPLRAQRPSATTVLQLAHTTSTVAASLASSGTAAFYSFATGSAVATGETATVWNYHDKTVASGATVCLAWLNGAWFVVDVGSCTNLS